MLESLVTCALFALAFSAIIRIHGVITRRIDDAAALSMAMDIAAQKAEEIAAMPLEQAPCQSDLVAIGCLDGSGALRPPLPVIGGRTCSQSFRAAFEPSPDLAGFRADTVVRHRRLHIPDDARLLIVSVCWRAAGGEHRQVQAARILLRGARG